jgi:hypothetical protein
MTDKPERRRFPPPWFAKLRLSRVVHLRFIRFASSCIVSKTNGITMSEEIEPQVTRRKLFLLVGLAASFAVPVSVLTASNAEAQQSEAQQPAEQPPKKKKKKKKEAAPTGTAPTPPERPKAQ